MNMKRMRGRNHRTGGGGGSGGGGGGGAGGNIRHHSGNIPLNRNHVFDSSGPDLRIRGTAQQLFEKYLQLGRDASSSGDRVMAESYFQHAEHYFRILNAMAQAAQASSQQSGQGQAGGQQGAPQGGQHGSQQGGGQGQHDRNAQNGGSANYPVGNRRNLYDQREGADLDDDQPDPLVPASVSAPASHEREPQIVERSQGERPRSNRSGGDRSGGDRSGGDRSGADRSGADGANAERDDADF